MSVSNDTRILSPAPNNTNTRKKRLACDNCHLSKVRAQCQHTKVKQLIANRCDAVEKSTAVNDAIVATSSAITASPTWDALWKARNEDASRLLAHWVPTSLTAT
jgi:hypothetical protein